MNKKKIEEIIELMDKYGLTEINVEDDGMKVHLRRGGTEAVTHILPHPIRQTELEMMPSENAGMKKEAKHLVEIKAPMVGTFYRSSSPDATPYVEIGSRINEGDILCIIEAMKLMNEIKSEIKGKIADILVENGQPIEFGQVLFLVEQT